MGQNIRLNRGVSRVASSTLDLLTSEERRCLDLSILQISVLRQMVYPWATLPERLVEDHGEYQTIVVPPQAYTDALEELEVLLSGAYDGPIGGCPVADKYVDRGDPASVDFVIGNLAVDGNWHSLDLTGIITDADATRVELLAVFTGPAPGALLGFRETNNVNSQNRLLSIVQVASIFQTINGDSTMGPDRSLDYIASATLTAIYITVRGWWKPV